MTGQIDSLYTLHMEDVLPPEDAMKAMMNFDDMEAIDNVPDGFSQIVKFGGSAKVEWGCKVVFAKKDGKFSKQSECGGKGSKVMGQAPE